jgi:hypothetical protein
MDERAMFRVQVCYAKPDQQIVQELRVPAGTALHAAITQSGILQRVPEITLETCKVGIYGKLKALDTVLHDHDRIEIYRPLVADPKEARRKRAAKKA